MNEKIVKCTRDAERLLKDKKRLEKDLDSRDTLETQNEILRHLEGLLIDGSQA
jgi:hypothetical protein